MSEIAGIVLAAGRGTRFGAEPKMLAQIDGEPLVRRVATTALAGGLDPVIVVTGHRADEVADALAGLPVQFIRNPEYVSGLSTSLKAGFEALPRSTKAALITLGDMPGVRPELIRRLTKGWLEGGRPSALVPTHEGRRGNPVLLSSDLADHISALTGDHGAGPLLRSLPGVVELAVDDESVLIDVDTPEALTRYLARVERREKPMHIGLIGGIGVAATLVYYQRLAAAVARRTGSQNFALTIVHGDIAELIRNNLADCRDEQARAFLPLLQRLHDAGCDCAALTSLGAHFCFDELAAKSPLPLISGVTPLDPFFADQGIGRIGLLGTRVVMRTRLYGQLVRTDAIALDDEIETIGQTYQDVAVAGECSPQQRQLFIDAGARMMAAGADAIVLAGTDLNLAFDGAYPGYPVIDALDIHVELLADLATGRADLAKPAAQARTTPSRIAE